MSSQEIFYHSKFYWCNVDDLRDIYNDSINYEFHEIDLFESINDGMVKEEHDPWFSAQLQS